MIPPRSVRVSELIKRELATILNSPREKPREFFLTLTAVRTSKDIKYADVWVSVMGDSAKRKKAIGWLRGSAGRLRHKLGQNLRIRRVPELRFELDETLDNAERIESILKSEGLSTQREESTPRDDD